MTEGDVRKAVQSAISMAEDLGFGKTQKSMIATATSELARNIFIHGNEGAVYVNSIKKDQKLGIEILAKDNGPGIPDIDLALQDNYSSRGSLGIGLPGTKRLMDDFEIESTVGVGTTIKAKKWL